MHDVLQATRRLGADEVGLDRDGRLRNLPSVGVVKE